MITSDERKLAASAYIPLEIDPVSILSLSKGVIFDTIVHNIEYTFSNRRTDSLPWKLVGMSLICDANRNKKYLQKLQKMQCVPSIISTQIYHSKLVKTESGKLTTLGRKLVIPTIPRKRLTGIIVCRSIDELLHMEPPNTQNVHFLQYKLLSYERIATRELVNGPKLSSTNDKTIKTVFDFELTQNNGFPRQLLPFAIISFARQDGCDLCLSIRNFLKLDEHKTFDKTYLVTSTNSELDHLREEQERKEDAEAEQELPWEKIQRRQPLADLSKKTTDTGNARPSTVPQSDLRVPPLKIKLNGQDKQFKKDSPRPPVVFLPPLESKFQCKLKLDRIDLSTYDIVNLSTILQSKNRKINEFSTKSSDSFTNKIKTIQISKPHDHHKPLKRLNSAETKKQSSHSSEIPNEKRNDKIKASQVSQSNPTASLNKDDTSQRVSSTSIKKRSASVEKPITKKKIKRPILPPEYNCSVSLSSIDLSMYNIDLPPIHLTSISFSPMDTESTSTTLSSISPSVETMEQENISDAVQSTLVLEKENISTIQQMEDFHINETFTMTNNVISSSSINNTVLQANDESVLAIVDDISPVPSDEEQSQSVNEPVISETDQEKNNEYIQTAYEPISPATPNGVQLETSNEALSTATTDLVSSEIMNEIESNIENKEATASSDTNITHSPMLPQFDDDAGVLSLESSPMNEFLDPTAQDYIIIVPCSDDEDDEDDNEIRSNSMSAIKNDTPEKILELSSPTSTYTSPILSNPSLTRILADTCSLDSHRSSTSSCSSLSSPMLHNQTPRLPLHLTETSIPQKIRNKQQKSTQPISFNRHNINIPLCAYEPLIDPRLIYRLQAITTDLRWSSSCNRCPILKERPVSFRSSTKTISSESTSSSDFVDPRRESLKQVILNVIYQRLEILLPHLFMNNSNSSQWKNLLFEQTVFKTNCSVHLEYLLQRIKATDEKNFFHLIKNQDEFQLSSSLLQLIFI